MFELIIHPVKLLRDSTNEIINVKETILHLEHSLISLKRWEQKWHKPFLTDTDKTMEELVDYIRCMTINKVDDSVYLAIEANPGAYMEDVVAYIQNPMTATWFADDKLIGAQKSAKEVVTNEIIYYWMVSFNIPPDYQKWHLNALLTLIKVISVKNQKPKKMTPAEASAQRKALNAQRRARMHSKG